MVTVFGLAKKNDYLHSYRSTCSSPTSRLSIQHIVALEIEPGTKTSSENTYNLGKKGYTVISTPFLLLDLRVKQ